MRMQALLEILTASVQGQLRRRQSGVPAALRRDLQQRGIEVLFHPYLRSIADLLDGAGANSTSRAVAALRRRGAHRCGARLRARRAVVFDTVDLHFLREERQAEWRQRDGRSAAGRSATRSSR